MDQGPFNIEEYDTKMSIPFDEYLLNILTDSSTPMSMTNQKLYMLMDSNPQYKEQILDFTKRIYDKKIKKSNDNIIITIYLNDSIFETIERLMYPVEDQETGHVYWTYDGNEYNSKHVIPIELPLWAKWIVALCQKCKYTNIQWNATSTWHDDFGPEEKYYDDKALNILLLKK